MDIKYTIIIYLAGAIAKQFEVYVNRNYYIPFTIEYVTEKLYMRPYRFIIAFYLASLAATWPLDIVLDIYFKFFYKGD